MKFEKFVGKRWNWKIFHGVRNLFGNRGTIQYLDLAKPPYYLVPGTR